MSDKSNKYGYVGVDIPAQSFGSNKGVFNPAEINDLVANNQWTSFGQLELIETQSVSGVSNVTFSDIKQDIYNVHFVTINNITNSATSEFRSRLIYGGTSQGSYQEALQYGYSTGTFGEARSTGVTQMRFGNNYGYTNAVGNAYAYYYNLGDSTKYSFITTHITQTTQATPNYLMWFGSYVAPTTQVMDSIEYYPQSGTTSVDISLYGIRYS